MNQERKEIAKKRCQAEQYMAEQLNWKRRGFSQKVGRELQMV